MVNEQQQLIGPANSVRFPDYASLNLGIEKRIRLFTREWAMRLTILNVTSHANPDSVINNVDSPNFMRFAGGQKRSHRPYPPCRLINVHVRTLHVTLYDLTVKYSIS